MPTVPPPPEQLLIDVAALKSDVAELRRATAHGMAHTTKTLIDQGARLDRLQSALSELRSVLDAVQGSIDGEKRSLGGLQGVMQSALARLDRLLGVALAERNASAERFAELDRRLDRLEQRLSIHPG